MAALTDLAKKVRNTKNRQSQAFLRTETLDKDGPSHSITKVDESSAPSFTVGGDQTSNNEFSVGYTFYVDGSTGNDGLYTVEATTYDSGNDETLIETEEDTPDATADGTIYTDKDYDYVNMGRIMDASFNAEPIASDPDQDGRESSQLFDITVSWTLMQASNTELSVLPDLAMPDPGDYEFYLNGHYVYFSGDNQVATSDVNNAVSDDPDPDVDGTLSFGTNAGELDDPDGILFQNVLLKPSAEINLSGETALIPIEFTGRLLLDEVASVDSDQKITVSPN